jgi:hypothetical protein
VSLPFALAADLQDQLLTVAHDLDRLQALLRGACDALQSGFFGATGELRSLAAASPNDAAAVERAVDCLGAAVGGLQFQDLASQLIEHTRSRLRHCTDQLADAAFASDEDGAAVVAVPPLRPNPVTQSEMATGHIELF